MQVEVSQIEAGAAELDGEAEAAKEREAAALSRKAEAEAELARLEEAAQQLEKRNAELSAEEEGATAALAGVDKYEGGLRRSAAWADRASGTTGVATVETLPAIHLLRAASGGGVAPNELVHDAAARGDADALRVLLEECGAPANAYGETDKGSCTALFSAAAGGHDECVALLMAAGADVRVPSMREVWSLPLHEAAERDLASTVRVMAEAGAPLHLPNVRGSTPLQLARAKGADAAAEALIEAMDERGEAVVRGGEWGWGGLGGVAAFGERDG